MLSQLVPLKRCHCSKAFDEALPESVTNSPLALATDFEAVAVKGATSIWFDVVLAVQPAVSVTVSSARYRPAEGAVNTPDAVELVPTFVHVPVPFARLFRWNCQLYVRLGVVELPFESEDPADV